MEWLILLLLAPMLIVPVVLLYGFTGCDLVFLGPPHDEPPEPPARPSNLTATAVDLDRIALAWEHLGEPVETFTFHVTRTGGSAAPQPAPVATLGMEDTGLDEGTTYVYQVKAIRDSDQAESQLSDLAIAATLSWKPIFSTEGIPPNPSNGTDAANDTIVQRVNGVSSGGVFARITLRGIVNETTVLTGVTISKAVPAGALQPWNSADPPVPITFGGVAGVNLPNGAVAVSDKINYAVTQGENLLAAFDVAVGSGRILRRNVIGALAFVGNNLVEAGLMIRSAGYSQDVDRAYCIEKIEVA